MVSSACPSQSVISLAHCHPSILRVAKDFDITVHLYVTNLSISTYQQKHNDNRFWSPTLIPEGFCMTCDLHFLLLIWRILLSIFDLLSICLCNINISWSSSNVTMNIAIQLTCSVYIRFFIGCDSLCTCVHTLISMGFKPNLDSTLD